MARFTRIQVATTFQQMGILPLFYHADIEICKNLLKACYDGGIRAVEFTNRGDFAHEVFGELNKYAAKDLPEMILGIGSVLDAGTTSLFIQLGANFVVSPVLNPDMAKVCNRRKILWAPGCGSLSEISYAEELGAEIVKIFPGAEVGGPGFVKAVKGPCPWTSIMPTGGVSPTREGLKEWFDAGVTCVGMGSQLISADVIKNRDYAGLTEKVKSALALVKEVRK
ncbi:MAG: bifunctional 4-hydroxy-2-oxoglutarate aldolase/2-dehydro-3-deoxy-phosphogluconate aldolase [Bacteroidia bacterium]|nr:bifunctional 4-hydroxy-2-oxoglutarate aldolase/2-dehydro-3-deoxy-phosphogluconate aldolase [Bacteroidia bacterium]